MYNFEGMFNRKFLILSTAHYIECIERWRKHTAYTRVRHTPSRRRRDRVIIPRRQIGILYVRPSNTCCPLTGLYRTYYTYSTIRVYTSCYTCISIIHGYTRVQAWYAIAFRPYTRRRDDTIDDDWQPPPPGYYVCSFDEHAWRMITNRHGLAAVTIFIFLNYPRARRDTAYPKSNFEELEVFFFGFFFLFSYHYSRTPPVSLSLSRSRSLARRSDVFGLFCFFFSYIHFLTIIDVLINYYCSRCL